MGGGSSIRLYHNGVNIDCVNDDEGNFSPDAGNDIMLGSAVPPTHSSDDELIGGSDIKSGDQVINEDLGSLQDLLSQVESARLIVTYSVIGLIIAILAYALVNFVLSNL